ncbi:hypothetical protein [Paraburkholderia sp. BR14320]|uniref:hypothetical protein n=1 Tax=unclassified Paraburkholderia TaxID=2615204 RepID=UPI0034CF1F5A
MIQRYAAYNDAGTIFTFWNSVDAPPPDPMPDGVHALAITEDEYMAALTSRAVPYTVLEGVLVAPTLEAIDAFNAREAWAVLQDAAMAALRKSDITVLRCYEQQIQVPAEWRTYRAALRLIVSAPSGDAAAGLPTMPAYPTDSPAAIPKATPKRTR